jgi:hypothetical protein
MREGIPPLSCGPAHRKKRQGFCAKAPLKGCHAKDAAGGSIARLGRDYREIHSQVCIKAP